MRATGLNNQLYAKDREPLDKKTKIEGSAASEAQYISYAWVGLVFYSKADNKHYKVTALDSNGNVSAYEEFGGSSNPSADDVSFDGDISGLDSDTVQDAIDEVYGDTINEITGEVNENGSYHLNVWLEKDEDEATLGFDIPKVSSSTPGVMTPTMLEEHNSALKDISVNATSSGCRITKTATDGSTEDEDIPLASSTSVGLITPSQLANIPNAIAVDQTTFEANGGISYYSAYTDVYVTED